MSATQTLISFDFGSEYIRVAKTRFDPTYPEILTPQIVEFNGQRSLRNVLLLKPTEPVDLEEIGEAVYREGLASGAPELLRRSLVLEDPVQGESGQATDLMLRHIRQVLELEQIADDDRAGWRTLVAVPVGYPADMADRWVQWLQRAGFPAPQALDSAFSILCGHLQWDVPPGRYLVIDCGASSTRLALCQVESQRRVQSLAVKAGPPGGRDFDHVLTGHFDRTLVNSTIHNPGRQLELGFFVEEFKKLFARELLGGEQFLQALFYAPSAEVCFELYRTDFESASLAGELISSFRRTAFQFLHEQGVHPADLDGILVAGGGAHWPFVSDWAKETVGPGKTHLGEYPEEIIVRGLPFLALSPAVSRCSGEMEAKATTRASGPQPRSAPLRNERTAASTQRLIPPREISPISAFWLEFVGGLVGVLGLGWFVVLKSMPRGCLSLLGWWAFLAAAITGLLVASAATVTPLPLLILVPIWALVPLLSARAAYKFAIQRRSRGGGE